MGEKERIILQERGDLEKLEVLPERVKKVLIWTRNEYCENYEDDLCRTDQSFINLYIVSNNGDIVDMFIFPPFEVITVTVIGDVSLAVKQGEIKCYTEDDSGCTLGVATLGNKIILSIQPPE